MSKIDIYEIRRERGDKIPKKVFMSIETNERLKHLSKKTGQEDSYLVREFLSEINEEKLNVKCSASENAIDTSYKFSPNESDKIARIAKNKGLTESLIILAIIQEGLNNHEKEFENS